MSGLKSPTIQVELTPKQAIELLRWLEIEENVTGMFRHFSEKNLPEKNWWVGIEGDNFKKVGSHYEVRLSINPWAILMPDKLMELLRLLGFEASNYTTAAKEQ